MTEIPESILVVDGPNLYSRCKFKLDKMKRSDGFPTGAIYGFVRTLQAEEAKRGTSVTVVCWEGGGKERRRKMAKEYKADRVYPEAQKHVVKKRTHAKPDGFSKDEHGVVERTVDVYGEHMRWLFAYLYASGRGSMRVGGMEADDLIAQFVFANRDPQVNRNVFILSSDHDFKKLLFDQGVTLIQNKKDFDAIDLYEQYKCSAEEYAMAAYLSGDSSDNIQGIPGIGTIKALKMLAKHDWDIEKVIREEPKAQEYEANIRLAMQVLDFLPVPEGEEVSMWLREDPDEPAVESLLTEMEFTSLKQTPFSG